MSNYIVKTLDDLLAELNCMTSQEVFELDLEPIELILEPLELDLEPIDFGNNSGGKGNE